MTDTATTTTPVKVGDVFVESWGYDQTNIDYYQVTRISASGKTVWLRHVNTALVSGGGPSEMVAPLPDAFHERRGPYDDGIRSGEEFRRKLTGGYAGAPWVSLTSYSGASLWDCRPHHQTGFGWGH